MGHARLTRSPTAHWDSNEHDPNAVAVVSAQGAIFGYLTKGLAKELSPQLRAGVPIEASFCEIRELGKRGILVMLELTMPATNPSVLNRIPKKQGSTRAFRDVLVAVNPAALASAQPHDRLSLAKRADGAVVANLDSGVTIGRLPKGVAGCIEYELDRGVRMEAEILAIASQRDVCFALDVFGEKASKNVEVCIKIEY